MDVKTCCLFTDNWELTAAETAADLHGIPFFISLYAHLGIIRKSSHRKDTILWNKIAKLHDYSTKMNDLFLLYLVKTS